jgi:hypothetical protein
MPIRNNLQGWGVLHTADASQHILALYTKQTACRIYGTNLRPNEPTPVHVLLDHHEVEVRRRTSSDQKADNKHSRRWHVDLTTANRQGLAPPVEPSHACCSTQWDMQRHDASAASHCLCSLCASPQNTNSKQQYGVQHQTLPQRWQPQCPCEGKRPTVWHAHTMLLVRWHHKTLPSNAGYWQWTTVQYSTVHYRAVAVLYSTVQYSPSRLRHCSAPPARCPTTTKQTQHHQAWALRMPVRVTGRHRLFMQLLPTQSGICHPCHLCAVVNS